MGNVLVNSLHHKAHTTSPTAPAATATGECVVVVNANSEILNLVGDTLAACRVLPASNYRHALEILASQEVGLVVSGVEGSNKDSNDFFSLLKREYPQVVTIIIAQSENSESMINLIKDARIYRYLFQPLKVGLLEQYLKSGLRQFQYYKSTTKLPVQQSVSASTAPISALEEAKGLRRFFSKF